MKDYTSEIKILWKCYDIIQKQHEKQYIEDGNKYTKNQKVFMNKTHIICTKIWGFGGSLYN